MLKLFTDKISRHLSSSTLVFIIVFLWLVDHHYWLDSLLPQNGKPLAAFFSVSIVALYELITCGQKNIKQRTDEIVRQIEINRVIHSVNNIYDLFTNSKDEYIDNEYTIKEIAELNDAREKLNINSYTQGKLQFLASKINLG